MPASINDFRCLFGGEPGHGILRCGIPTGANCDCGCQQVQSRPENSKTFFGDSFTGLCIAYQQTQQVQSVQASSNSIGTSRPQATLASERFRCFGVV